MKKIIYILVIIIGLGWLVSVFKNKIAKSFVEKAVAETTGLKLEISSLDIGLLKTELTVQDLRLFNPAGYKEPVMFYIPYVYLDYNFADLIKKNIHIENMELDLKELFVIKDKSGKFNLSALRPVRKGEALPSKAKPEEQAPVPRLEIDKLLLKIGKVTYKDYSKDPDNPAITEFKLNFQGRYVHITDMRSLVKLIVGRALFDTALDKLANLDVGGLRATVEGAASAAKDAAEKAGTVLKDTFQGIGQVLEPAEKK